MARDDRLWRVDITKSLVKFTLRHLVLSEISGHVRSWCVAIRIDREYPARSSVEAVLYAHSVDTESAERDDHIRSEEFLNAAAFPEIRFRSREVRHADGDRYSVVGDLTIRKVTREVVLDVEDLGRLRDGAGAERAKFRAHATINRQHFGLRWNQDLDTGGIVLGDKIDLALSIEAVADVTGVYARPELTASVS